jgi:hypothetical protein
MALIDQISDSELIPLGLGHLLAFHQEELGVHPVPDERLPGGALALSNLVLVMRENQIDPTSV